ncbi:MAG: hypothetical protein J6Y98_00920 [Bacteroidales bacterium]|nr:hypothetical protein [Bacteroidales bacterium]
MGHNKDRRPTYPVGKKKSSGKSIVKLLTRCFEWLCIAFVVFFLVYASVNIPYNYIQRNHIKNNPVETEAVITRIGDATRWIGPCVYYDYYVEDSLYHVEVAAGHKIADQLRVGQTINITYEKDNPSNSMYGETLSQAHRRLKFRRKDKTDI